jgi:uncharacterized protein
MKDILKKMIVEKQEWLKKIKLHKREIPIEAFANYVFIGLRRAGKSYFLYQLIQEKCTTEAYERILFINFEDERLLEISHLDLQLILEAYYEMYETEPIIFLDEIQNVPHWQKFVRRLADEGKKVYVTGSNAEMLSSEIATTLGGRFVNKEILPLSFQEYLHFKEIKVSQKILFSSERYNIIKEFETYMHYGGFPELIKIANKKEFLSSVYQKLFYGDLIARYKINNVFVLKLLVKKLAESVNNETSVNRIKNLIKSTGVSIGNNTLFEYLGYLEASYLIASISNYHDKFSEKETIKKYYFMDSGILGLFLTDQPTKLLENLVYIALRRQGEKIYFLKRKTEIDFYLPEKSQLIQVSHSIAQLETATRELNALKKAMKELNLSKAWIITFDEQKEILLEEGIIYVVPAWQWLLNLR